MQSLLISSRRRLESAGENVHHLLALRHRNVAKIVDFIPSSGGVCAALCMTALSHAECLQDKLTHGGFMDPIVGQIVTRELLNGLAFLHRQGLAHTAVSCANAVVAPAAVLADLSRQSSLAIPFNIHSAHSPPSTTNRESDSVDIKQSNRIATSLPHRRIAQWINAVTGGIEEHVLGAESVQNYVVPEDFLSTQSQWWCMKSTLVPFPTLQHQLCSRTKDVSCSNEHKGSSNPQINMASEFYTEQTINMTDVNTTTLRDRVQYVRDAHRVSEFWKISPQLRIDDISRFGTLVLSIYIGIDATKIWLEEYNHRKQWSSQIPDPVRSFILTCWAVNSISKNPMPDSPPASLTEQDASKSNLRGDCSLTEKPETAQFSSDSPYCRSASVDTFSSLHESSIQQTDDKPPLPSMTRKEKAAHFHFRTCADELLEHPFMYVPLRVRHCKESELPSIPGSRCILINAHCIA